MHNIIGNSQYYNKIFNKCEYHNQNLSDLFLNKEYQLKPVSVDYDRIKGLQTYNDLYNIFEWDSKSIKWLGNNRPYKEGLLYGDMKDYLAMLNELERLK